MFFGRLFWSAKKNGFQFQYFWFSLCLVFKKCKNNKEKKI